MNDFRKTLLLAALLGYIVSPVDAALGPIDDVIAALLGIAARRHFTGPE